MALSALRGRGDDERGSEAPLEIGASDGLVVHCPVCSRPIVAEARRCPGCGTRLLMGVPARRASVFLATGALTGVLVGGLVVGSVALALQPAATTPGASAPVTGASAVPRGGASSAPAVTGAPAASVAALRQAVAINGRLALGVDDLRSSVATRPFDSFAVASVLRSLAADAAIGSDAAGRLQPWSDADAARTALTALYDEVRATARAGLANAFANGSAYRAAASDMIAVLGGLETADAAARTLAETVAIELPAPVTP